MRSLQRCVERQVLEVCSYGRGVLMSGGVVRRWDMKVGYGGGIWRWDMEVGYGGGIWRWDMEVGYGGGIWTMDV
jgi:hypothetical protein